MLAAYQTSAWEGTTFYFIATFVFAAFLIVLKYTFFRGREMPFEFTKNAPAYAYTLAFLYIPIMYFLAQGLTYLTTGVIASGSWLRSGWFPEVFQHFFSLTDIPIILPAWLGSVSVYLQEFALQVSDVGPAEELFKTAVWVSVLVVILWWREQSSGKPQKIGIATVFVVGSLINGLWVAMHGIVAYHTASDFLIALVEGELLLAPTWLFGTPFPAVIAHGTWNTFEALDLLIPYVMYAMMIIFGTLTVYFYFRNRRRHKQTV